MTAGLKDALMRCLQLAVNDINRCPDRLAVIHREAALVGKDRTRVNVIAAREGSVAIVRAGGLVEDFFYAMLSASNGELAVKCGYSALFARSCGANKAVPIVQSLHYRLHTAKCRRLLMEGKFYDAEF